MTAFCELRPVTFPIRTGIACNMMPIVMGDIKSIPAEFRGYASLLDACAVEPQQLGKVGYLSVQENAVTEKHPTQRKPGIHIENHQGAAWGGGSLEPVRQDGIYMASTVSGSCRIWDAHIIEDSLLGDFEHMRNKLGAPTLLLANVLYWLTDRTPHEAVPMAPGTFRQFFRLVTHKVELWYSRYSTANPLGIAPPCEIRIR